MSKRIPFLSLDHQHNEISGEVQASLNNLYTKGLFVLGSKVKTFEEKFASFTGVEHCIGTGNGFDAIRLSLKALDIGEGDEVIVPSNTCMPTWLAVSSVGARVVPVEPDIRTYNIDPSKIEQAITGKTKAIVPVHLYGQACDMDSIMKIAKRNKLHVVEDNAQGHGATFNGKRTGSFGIVNATSFYPTKNLGALGDGGAVTTNNKALAEKILALRNYGQVSNNNYGIKGINSRLDELQAAILLIKLKKLNSWNKQRHAIAKTYTEKLSNVKGLMLPVVARNATHVFHLFVVRTKHRDNLVEYLENNGIGTMIHYPIPPHQQEAYKDHGFSAGQFPVANEIAATCLSLPCWPGMTPRQIESVAATVARFFSLNKG